VIDYGIQAAAGLPILHALPLSWLGTAKMPAYPPGWGLTAGLTATQTQNLLAEIAYDQSQWNYQLIGTSNALGAYQVSTQTLENYGFLAPGSNAAYGNNCVNHQTCWRPTPKRNVNNSYSNYLNNTTSLTSFLSNTVTQDYLALQMIHDLYYGLTNIDAIQSTDAADVVAGMIYVAWTVGVGTPATNVNSSGTGAWGWRYNNVSTPLTANAFNSGRYAVTVLTQ